MACNDRQLTQAQREEGYQNQRTGVVQAVRPFTGTPSVENLVDYINRELFPAIKASRAKVNDVYERVRDNAPSGNPLQFYFSTETGAADPTTGRVRLNQATQDTATVIRVSQTNGRLQDVAPWLDVMSGGATTPLGTLTLSDVVNPARFLRFDLNTMVDQGAYWDLGVTIIESSHDNPFVEDGGVAIAFIPAVAAAGATVPPSAISPIATDTFLGNITGASAAPSATPLASIDSTSITYDGTAHEFRRAALTGFVDAAANANATTSAEPIVTFSASSNMSNERVLSNGTGTTIDIGTAGQIQVDIDTPLTDGDKGDITVSSNGTNWQIDANTITNTELDDMAAGTVIGRQIDAGTGDPVDLTGLEVGELLRLGTVQNTTIAATTNDQSIGTDTTVLRITPTGAQTLTGITGGSAGRLLVVENVAAAGNNLTLASLDAGSLAANRIRTPGAVALVIGLRESCVLRWDADLGAWRVIAQSRMTAVADADYGDITVSSSATVWTVDNDVITNAKLANVSSPSLKGRTTASSGDPEDLTLVDSTSVTWNTGTGGSISLQRAALTGDVTASANSNATTIANDAVTDAKLRNSGALSVIGRSANSTGDPADISATAGAGGVLRESGSTVGFGTITLAAFPTIADDTFLANIAGSTTQPTAVALTTLAGAGLTGGADAILNVGAGTGITVNANDIAVTIPLTDGDKGDITVASSGTSWTVDNDAITNAKLANMAGATVKGRTLTGGTGDPVDLTGAEVGQLIRFATDAEDTSTGTVASFTIASTTTSVRFTPATALTVQGLAYTGPADPEAGKEVLLYCSRTSTVNVTLAHNSGSTGAATYRFFLPGNVDMVLRPGEAVRLRYAFSRWIAGQKSTVADGDYGDITVSAAGATWTVDNDAITNAKLANMTAGTVKGVQIDGATGDPQDLSGLEVGELLRLGTTQALTIAATTNDQSLNADANVLRVTCTGSQTLTGITGGVQGRPLFVENISGSGNNLTLSSLSASSLTANRFRTPNGVDLVLRFRESALLRWETNNGDWRVVSIARSTSVADADYGDITVSSSGATWTIDNDVVSNAKLANMASPSLKGRTTASSGDPEDLTLVASTSITWNTATGGSISLERAALTGDVTASANANATTIANDAVTNAKLANVAAGTVKGLQVDASGPADPVDLTGLEVGELLRVGTTQAVTIAATTNDQSLNADTNVLRVTCTGSQSFTGMTGGSAGRVVVIENVSGSGNNLTLIANSGSLTANQLRLPNNTNIVLRFRESAIARWDATEGDWRVISTGRATAVADGNKGDITVSSGGTSWAINNNAVTDALLRDSGALSVIGRSANSSGDPADISAVAASGAVLRESGSTIGFGTVATAGIADAAITLAKMENRAQATVIGRAEGAGTGVPQELSTTQLAALVDGEAFTWTAAHTFSSRVSWAGILATTLAATTNDLAIGAVNVVRITLTGDQTLTGMVPNANDQVVYLEVSDSTDSLTISHDATSTTTNRFVCPNNADLVLGPRGSAVCRYDATSSRWYITGAAHNVMAQSRIRGRAEGAGTGTPTDLTPTQVVAIIDAESPTWTGSHTFNSTTFTSTTSGNTTISSTGTGETQVTGGTNLILSAGTAIGLNSPTDLNNHTTFSAVLSSTLTGNVDDLNVSGVTVVRLTPNAAGRRLRGMAPGRNGQILLLFNISTANSMVLVDESDTVDGTSSSAANRFRLPSTTSQTIGVSNGALMWYDGTTSRWRMR